MAPLNDFIFDDSFIEEGPRISSVRSQSPTSFRRDCRTLKFAFPTRTKKSVSFNHQIEVVYLPSRSDWSEEEMISRWNSDGDYTNFQLDIMNTIYLMRNHPDLIDDTSHSSRGVECKEPNARRLRRQHKQEAWDVVFERQKIQRQMKNEIDGYNYLVALMYCHVTQRAMRSALDLAAQDEFDADKIRSEDNFCHDKEVDFFDHSWISTCASSHSESSSLSSSTDNYTSEKLSVDESGFCVFGDDSEFDNSWLRLDL